MEKRLAGFDDELGELLRHTPLWRERDELLRPMPGVGKVLSSILLAQLPELGGPQSQTDCRAGWIGAF